MIVHESYNASVSWNNDIALLRVKPKQNRGIRFSPYVQPLCLPPVNAPYITDTPCAVYGWGATRQNPFLPGVLFMLLRYLFELHFTCDFYLQIMAHSNYEPLQFRSFPTIFASQNRSMDQIALRKECSVPDI